MAIKVSATGYSQANGCTLSWIVRIAPSIDHARCANYKIVKGRTLGII